MFRSTSDWILNAKTIKCSLLVLLACSMNNSEAFLHFPTTAPGVFDARIEHLKSNLNTLKPSKCVQIRYWSQFNAESALLIRWILFISPSDSVLFGNCLRIFCFSKLFKLSPKAPLLSPDLDAQIWNPFWLFFMNFMNCWIVSWLDQLNIKFTAQTSAKHVAS